MLVDDPQAVVAGGQNEGLAQLPQRPERAQVVEVGGGLLGLDQGRFRRRIRACCIAGAWRAVAGGRQAGRLEQRRRSLAPRLLVSPSAGIECLGSEGQFAGNGRGKARRQLAGFSVCLGGLERGRIGVGLRRKRLRVWWGGQGG